MVAQLMRNNHSLVVEGRLNGRPSTITLDTGASKSVIRPDIVTRKAINPEIRYQLKAANGESVTVQGECDIAVRIVSLNFRHQFIVADIIDECILGLDFMTEHGISLDMKEYLLRWRNIEIPLGLTDGGNGVRVILRDPLDIGPMCEALAYACIDGDPGSMKVGILEPAAGIYRTGLLYGKTLTSLGASIPVRIMNITEQAKHLKSGVVLGKIQPAVSIVQCNIEASADKCKSNSEAKKSIQRLCQHLKGEQFTEAVRMLSEFTEVFPNSKDDYGRTEVVQHKIKTGDTPPIRQPPRRLPLAKQEEAGRMIQQMCRDKIIEPSNSPWSSPVVLVQKKDGSMRFCVDYRKLNDVTKKDSYPLPRIDDTLDTLSESTLFSTLDLKSGYWQVAIQEEDREKTAFSTGTGLWQFTVMPFGLCNAPATFERLMEQILRGLHWKTCLVYLDDIIVIGKSFDEHLKNLCEVLRCIKAAGMKVSSDKCALFKNEVKYLGHIVSEKGIRTDPEKIEAVRSWPVPKNVHEVRSFLGLCTYYRRFVANFSYIAASLHKLTEISQPFQWTEACQTSFEQLKTALCQAPILAYPRPDQRFILDTDASSVGIGGVLSQQHGAEERVICYFSRILSRSERNYCVTRRELLAVVECVKHFHKYLYGQQFLIRTDHAALKWLMQFKEPEGQVARWIERLQNYTFNIEHRKGRVHGNADSLSRRPCAPRCQKCSKVEAKEGINNLNRIGVEVPAEWTTKSVAEEQENDPTLAPVRAWINKGQKPSWHEISETSPTLKSYWAQWNSLKLENGVLKRAWESVDGKTTRMQTVLPKCRIPEVLNEIHNGTTGGHLGINKTLAKVRERFYWVNCRSDVDDWCKKCHTCAASKGPARRTRGRMQQYNVGAPFERVAMDIAGPFPRTVGGNRYILVCIDYFSKWPEAYPIPNQEAQTVAGEFVNNWISRYGVPLELHSDQGRNFESNVFQEMCKVLGIKKTRTTPLHPQSDGMVERFNRTLEEHLAKVVGSNQENWDRHIPLFMMAYRSAVHDTTGITPSTVLFGREMRLPCDMEFGVPELPPKGPENYVSDLRNRMAQIHDHVRRNIKMNSDRSKARYDLRANDQGYGEGDLVWLYNPQRKRGKSPKLQSNWEGPYTIIKRINDVVYRIQRNQRAKMKVVHVDRLTRYQVDPNNVSVRDEQN